MISFSCLSLVAPSAITPLVSSAITSLVSRDNPSWKPAWGVTDEEWSQFERVGYNIHKNIIDPEMQRAMIESALLDFSAIGVNVEDRSTFHLREGIEGLNNG